MKRLVALPLILAFCLAIAAPAAASEQAAGTEQPETTAPAPAETEPTVAPQEETVPPEIAAVVQSLSPAQLKALAKLVQERLREMERQRERERLREEKPPAKPEPKSKPKLKLKYEPFKGRVRVNGKELKFDQPPVVREGRILVPLRAISEGLKAEVRWDPDAKTVTVIKGDTTVVLFLDKAEVLVNGEKVALDVPAVAVNGRTLVPLRFLNQVFRNRVEFNEKTDEVNIEEEEAEAGQEAAGEAQETTPAQTENAQQPPAGTQ